MRASLCCVFAMALPVSAVATPEILPHLRDRGPGISLSQFGTYVERGEFVVYPYFEYYRDENYEYAPNELGGTVDEDYRGSYRASEELIFLAYGVSERLAVELEAAIIQASLDRDARDDTGTPDRIEESGLGDVESQLRWRWAAETADRPEFFSYFETVFPTQEEGSLIGTTGWEFAVGSGLSRGFAWGTATVRAALGYEHAEETVELGEAAVEYLRRLSSTWRVFGAVEGTQDEVELITEAQLHLTPTVILKVNNAFGLTSKAPDWAPELGVFFYL